MITLEPEVYLYKFNQKRFRNFKNIELINGQSEEYFEKVLHKSGDSLNIWLDGHASGDVTFSNDNVTPIKIELEAIEKSLSGIREMALFIDDFRGFLQDDFGSPYPSRNFLINWATKNGFNWDIQQDIFIAKISRSGE